MSQPDMPFGDPAAVQTENRKAVGKGILFGCGGCGLIIAAFIAIGVIVALIVFKMMWSSDAVEQAVERAANAPEVQAALGTPIETGWVLSGNISLNNGAGTASVQIPISGPKGSATIVADATKEPGQAWTYRVLKVNIASPPQTIDLLGQAAEKPQP